MRNKVFPSPCFLLKPLQPSAYTPIFKCRRPIVITRTLDNTNAMRYYCGVIKNFASKETEKIFKRQFSRKLPQNIQQVTRRKLEVLDAAEVLQDLRIPPSNHLEKLSGNRKSQHSVRINDQWRICFEWRNGDAYSVEVTDYHST